MALTPPPGGAPYGPNTAAVRAFLRDLARQEPAAWARAALVYAAVSAGTPYVRADAALGAAIENAGLERARDALVGPLVQLASATHARMTAPAVSAEQLAEAALAAALALVARGVLAPELFDTLYAPFEPVVPAPPSSRRT